MADNLLIKSKKLVKYGKEQLSGKGVVSEATTIRGVLNEISNIEISGQYLVQVIDYDGTILKQAQLNTGDTFTLPDTPTGRDRLIFQEWSSPVTIINNTITVEDSDITIGAIYTTASGLNEFDVSLTKEIGLEVTLNIEGTKDWGDGTSDTETRHIYTDYGDYTITCDGTTITTSSTAGLFSQGSAIYNYYCTKCRLANITSIGNYAFSLCRSLKLITISNSVTEIGTYAFNNCESLISISVPNNITSIETYMFNSCSSLISIALSKNLTSIGNYSFQHCYSLKSITIPSNVESIGNYAFNNCRSLKLITISNSVTEIGTYAFQYCSALISISLPDNITSLHNYIFNQCNILKSIIIPNSVTEIGTYAFQYCYALISISLPDNITSIGNYAFSLCRSLTSIKLPSSLTNIGTYAFNNCYSLIYYDFTDLTQVPTLGGTNAFQNINKIAKMIVPDALYDEWVATTNWVTYANYIYKASEV